MYSDLAGPENACRYKTEIYLAASEAAEFFRRYRAMSARGGKGEDAGGNSSPYKGTGDGLRTIAAAEGVVGGLYKGLYTFWSRQIPYTMKFASFKTTVELIFRRGCPERRAIMAGRRRGGCRSPWGIWQGYCVLWCPIPQT
jgi:Mitochondrial carrier protein.